LQVAGGLKISVFQHFEFGHSHQRAIVHRRAFLSFFK